MPPGIEWQTGRELKLGKHWRNKKKRKRPTARNGPKNGPKNGKKKAKWPQILCIIFAIFEPFSPILGRGPFSIIRPISFPCSAFGPFSILRQAAWPASLRSGKRKEHKLKLWVRTSSGGVGSSTWRGGGQKVRYAPWKLTPNKWVKSGVLSMTLRGSKSGSKPPI